MPEAKILFCCWGDCQQTIPFPESNVWPGFCRHCKRAQKWIEIRGVVGERAYELNFNDKRFLKSLRIQPD